MMRLQHVRASVVLAILMGAALGPALSARQGETPADLRTQLQARYDILALQDGVALVPRQPNDSVRTIQVRNGPVVVNGEELTGRELRMRLGADADLVLRVTYLDAAGLGALVGGAPTTLPAPAPAASPAPADRSTERRRGRGSDLVRIMDDITVAKGEIVNGDVHVILGDATIDGEVNGHVAVVMGDVSLGPEAVVSDDVIVVGGTLTRAPGARVD